MPLTLVSGDAKQLENEKQVFRTKLATAFKDEDDPLAVFDQFVQWTLQTYGENDPNSGLPELLEQAARAFIEDPLYKTDLRYLKLWSLHARQVERPAAIAIYAYLLSNEIGTSYSVLYEEYATLLEADGRRQEAEMIYRKGIKRHARPLERLKNRYREFQSCSASSSTSPTSSSSTLPAKPNSQTTNLRRNPLKNQGNQASHSSLASPTSAPVNQMSLISTRESRYAHMLAPPAPEKRPEKPRFNLSLLFTDEGVEYCIQEARARSMGLLGKKWGPPPASEFTRGASSSSVPDDDGQRSTRLMALGGRRKSVMGGAEPTVTINTKEALADVFGMYNSPEKTSKLVVAGSKYAPLKKIEPLTPVLSQRSVLNPEDDNQGQSAKTPTPAFRPFVDENAQPARTTPGLAKFAPYVDPASNKTPVITPRAVLSFKNPAAPSSNSKLKEHVPRDPNNVLKLKPVPEAQNAENVFPSKVFTPAEIKTPLAPLREVFTDDHGKPQPKPKHTHERAKSHHDALAPAPEDIMRASAFTFTDEHVKTPFKVFSRPPEQPENSNAITPKTPIFTPLSVQKPAFTPYRDAPEAFKPCVDEAVEQVQPVCDRPGISCFDGSAENEDSIREETEPDVDLYNDEEPFDPYNASLNGDGGYEEEESYREIPLGGRFGQFNVMTPITERTFEFTSSNRGSTPSERFHHGTHDRDATYDRVIVEYRDEHGAALAAEQLVAELKEDEGEDYDDDVSLEPLQLSNELVPQRDEPAVEIIEKTGSLSLGDTLTLNSKFRPSNPCNPFEPPILATLLSRIPADPHCYDLPDRESKMLDNLQRFARKARKTSGNTSSTGVLDLSMCLPLSLENHKFSVLEKLGEGGFGTVFKARDLGTREDDGDSDDDLEDYEDEDASSMVALKVVKPRNLWEYHVLRRLISSLPAPLRRSVILPHALYAFRDESYLVLDLCRQGTLLNIVNNAMAAGISQQGACLDELLVMFFSIELLRLLEGIHNVGFIHGDLKIDNCLLRLEDVPGGASAWSGFYQPSGEGGWSYKGLKLIDFGRTIDTRLFPPGQQYIADWAADDRDCFQLRENRPWTFQTDYFGLAGIIYCMLYGKYIQASSISATSSEDGPRYKISTPMKRYWQTNLWNRLFDVLLNPGSTQQLPVSDKLRSLRVEMETWLQANCNRTSNTLKGLLKKVEVSCLIR